MRTRILPLIILLCAFSEKASGSFAFNKPDARVQAMGGAGVALENPPFGVLNNPASGVTGETWFAGVSYAIPFHEESFDSFHGILYKSGLPFDRDGNAGISWQRYGSSSYRETSTQISYSTKIAGSFRAGISAGILELHTDSNGSDSSVGISIGALAPVSPFVNLGFALLNVNRPKTGNGNETVPSKIVAGASYRPEKSVLLTAEMEKMESRTPRIRAGGEVKILPFMALRAGVTTEPSTFSGGTGFIFGNIQGDFSLVRHPELGTGTWYTIRAMF